MPLLAWMLTRLTSGDVGPSAVVAEDWGAVAGRLVSLLALQRQFSAVLGQNWIAESSIGINVDSSLSNSWYDAGS
jgi:hypothetical protein